MSKRFILSFAAAVLLGLASAQDNSTQQQQQEQWANENTKLALNDYPITVSETFCNFVDDWTYFNLDRLSGPYLGTVVTLNGYELDFEVKFCGISSFNATDKDRTAMVWALDSNGNRTHSVAGSAYENKKTVRQDQDGDMVPVGVKYDSWKSQDYCVYPVVAENNTVLTPGRYYYTSFEVNCNQDATLQLANFNMELDPNDSCHYIVTASHAAGCPTLEVSGFIQYLSGSPWLIALILISFGVASTFFGGLLWDYVVGTLAGIVVFFITAAVMDAFGGFHLLQDNVSAKFGNVVFCIFSFLLCIAASGAAGWFAAKTNQIGIYAVGAIGGFFAAVLIYGLVFAQFLTNAWFIWIFWIIGASAGGFFAYKFEGAIIVQLTALVGSYALIRGISMLAGGFISEYTIMEQISQKDFSLPPTFYAYMVGFVALAVGGVFWQYKKGYNNQNKNSALDENFLPK